MGKWKISWDGSRIKLKVGKVEGRLKVKMGVGTKKDKTSSKHLKKSATKIGCWTHLQKFNLCPFLMV